MGEGKVVEESVEREGGKFSGERESDHGINAERGEKREFKGEMSEKGWCWRFKEVERMVEECENSCVRGDFAKPFENGLMAEVDAIKSANGESCAGKIFGKGGI